MKARTKILSGLMLLLLAFAVRESGRLSFSRARRAAAPPSVAQSPHTRSDSPAPHSPIPTTSPALPATNATLSPQPTQPPVLQLATTPAPSAGGLDDRMLAQIQALQEAKARRTPVQRKVDSQLLAAKAMKEGRPIARGIDRLATGLEYDPAGRVQLEIKSQVNAGLAQAIADLGGFVTAQYPQSGAISASLPVEKLETLAARQDVLFVGPMVKSVHNGASLTKEGDLAEKVTIARDRYHVDGTGVKVGVISGDVSYLSEAQSSGNLPFDIQVIDPGPDPSNKGDGEGTAMLEIVHSLAPGARLAFCSGLGTSQGALAKAISRLAAAGCKIIVDDLSYPDESPFFDDVVAQAVNEVTASGVFYFSSAGNYGHKADGNNWNSSTWEGDFRAWAATTASGTDNTKSPPKSLQGTFHDFGGGQYLNQLVVPTLGPGEQPGLDLMWSDLPYAPSDDYDLYLFDATKTIIVARSDNYQTGRFNESPLEGFNSLPAGTYYVAIVLCSGGNSRFLHLNTGQQCHLAQSTAGNIRGHACATNAFAIAAVDATNYPSGFTSSAKVESFSSDGPRRMFFDPAGNPLTPGNFSSTGGIVRQKPDLAAADHVTTTTLNPFYGTSAAAPHAAAIAALLLQYNPNLTFAQIKAALTGSALPIEGSGWQPDTGYGIVMADAALAAVQAVRPPTVTAFTPSSGSAGQTVTLTGSGFTGATAVRFNGLAAPGFTVVSDAAISVAVPPGAASGSITVTTPAGSGGSADSFTVTAAPAIFGFAPASGSAGATVTITGANFAGATQVSFDGATNSFTLDSPTQITTRVPAAASGSGPIIVTTSQGSATSADFFTVTTLPVISGFSPTSFRSGAAVVISGANFVNVTAVAFNGLNAASFVVNSPSQITAVAPAGLANGVISVATANGTATSAGSYVAIPLPALTSFSPASGGVGDSIRLFGSGLTGASSVLFGGGASAAFSVVSDSEIQAIIPVGAQTGLLSVIAPGGTAASTAVFSVAAAPANDQFAQAQFLSGASGTVTGNNAGASRESGEPSHAGNPGGKSIWYQWQAPSNGVWAVDTTGSSFRTVVAVYTGSTLANLAPLAGYADSAVGTNHPRAAFLAAAGVRYYFAIDGYNDGFGGMASGNVVLNWSPSSSLPAITGFTPASGLVGAAVVINGANFRPASGVAFGGAPAVTFTVNSDTQITAIVPADAAGGPLSVTTPDGFTTSIASFNVIRPDGNDAFRNAQILTGLAGSVFGNNGNATKETGEPDHAGNPGGRSLWFQWRAPAAGTWEFDTFGSSFDTLLAVYSGAAISNLTPVAGNDDYNGGRTSKAIFTAAAGANYYIAVDGYNGASGDVALNWSGLSGGGPAFGGFTPASGGAGTVISIYGNNLTGINSVTCNGLEADFIVYSSTLIVALAPAGVATGPIILSGPTGSAASSTVFTVTNSVANDNFANAQILSGAAAFTSGANVGATKEPGEPNHAGNPGGHSVWYRWTAPATGRYTIDLSGSSFDTIMGVYIGGNPAALSLVASDDDSGANRASLVGFSAAAGTVYQIAVDGYSGATGDIALRISPAVAAVTVNPTPVQFETYQGYYPYNPLVGQNGWLGSGTGGTGLINQSAYGLGQSAYIGYNAPFVKGQITSAYLPLNYTPATAVRPILEFDAWMQIVNSSNFSYDKFLWGAYDAAGNFLFALEFDNASLSVKYVLNDGLGERSTGHYFFDGVYYALVISMDYAHNRWSASLDGVSVANNQPLSTKGTPASLGAVDAIWLPNYYAGNNFMVFDDYTVLAEPPAQPAILLNPQNQSVRPGDSVAFGVVAAGAGPLSYQWQFNGVNLPNATNAVLVLNDASAAQAGNYNVWVGNSAGSVFSSAATLVVSSPPAPPVITAQPQSSIVTAGATATFTVTALGTGPLFYTWWRNGLAVAGATNASLQLPGAQSSDSRSQFSCLISNMAGAVISAPATLLVADLVLPPVVVAHPMDQSVNAGGNASFSVTATGTAPLAYGWLRNGAPIAGAISPALLWTNAQLADSGSLFSCVVSNAGGIVASSTARLTVTNSNPLLPFNILALRPTAGRPFGIQFQANPNLGYTVLGSTNPALPISSWTTIGSPTLLSNGLFQFVEPGGTNRPRMFYRVRSP